MATPLQRFHYYLADRLAALEVDVRNIGLGGYGRLTLIVRDPADPGAIVCLTNEPPEGLAEACRLAAGLKDGGSTLAEGDALKIALGLE